MSIPRVAGGILLEVTGGTRDFPHFLKDLNSSELAGYCEVYHMAAARAHDIGGSIVTEGCVMRTDDLLALCNYPRAEHRRAFERRSVLIGAVLTAVLLGIALAEACAPSAEAFVSNSHEPSTSRALDRSGAFGLPILF